jgi:hypothetical protein
MRFLPSKEGSTAMNYQHMSAAELEKQKLALLKRTQGENPENAKIRDELKDVEDWIKVKKQEQEFKAKSASKNYPFRVGS